MRMWLMLAVVGAIVLPSQGAKAQEQKMKLDLFSGLSLNLRDINYERQYDVLINLTPGFRWKMGNHFELCGQAIVPLVNQYNYQSAKVRPRILALSKEMKVGPLCAKISGGFFSFDRYGVDLKAFLPVCDWFAFEGRFGCTGYYSLVDGWDMSPMGRLTGFVGGNIYIKRWKTQLRGLVGRFVYEDYGLECEGMRHFRHSTVGVYGSWNNYDKFNAGFRITAMLPPFKRRDRFLTIRPASCFNLSYAVEYHDYTNKLYTTDPEANIREGAFSRDILEWGFQAEKPDFEIVK